MKAYILTTLLSLSAVVATAQVVAIQNDMGNQLWLCTDNPLTVAVEGVPASAISLSTENGIITENNGAGAGHYIYQPATAGSSMIYVKKRTQNGAEIIIDSVQYRIRRVPFERPKLGGTWKGSSPHLWILPQLGINILGHFDIRGVNINSYEVSVLRKKKQIFNRKISGSNFDQETRDFFYKLKNGDHLIFKEIKIKDCDGELLSADPIDIIVKDAYSRKKLRTAHDTVMVQNPATGEEVEMIFNGAEIKKIKN